MRTVSAGPGNVPAATSAIQARVAVGDRALEVRVGAGVLRLEVAEAEQVGDDLDLAAARGPAPIPIVGMRRREVIDGGQLLRHELEHDRERAGLLDRDRVGEQGPGVVARLALDLDLAAEPVLRLGRPADVAHDRHAGLHERLDDPGAAHAALDLDRLCAAVLHEPARVLRRLLDRGVRQERHVADHERVLRPADDGPRVMEHLVHRDAHGRLVAERDLAQRIADEDHRDAGVVEDARGREVVRGEHRDALAVGVHAGRCRRS